MVESVLGFFYSFMIILVMTLDRGRDKWNNTQSRAVIH